MGGIGQRRKRWRRLPLPGSRRNSAREYVAGEAPGIHARAASVYAGKEGVAVEKGADSVEQDLTYLVFHHEALYRDGLGGFDDVLSLVHGEKQDRHLRVELADFPGSVETAETGHGDIKDNQVGLEFLGFGNGFQSVGSLTVLACRETRRENHADAFADRFVVVSDQNSNRLTVVFAHVPHQQRSTCRIPTPDILLLHQSYAGARQMLTIVLRPLYKGRLPALCFPVRRSGLAVPSSQRDGDYGLEDRPLWLGVSQAHYAPDFLDPLADNAEPHADFFGMKSGDLVGDSLSIIAPRDTYLILFLGDADPAFFRCGVPEDIG